MIFFQKLAAKISTNKPIATILKKFIFKALADEKLFFI